MKTCCIARGLSWREGFEVESSLVGDLRVEPIMGVIYVSLLEGWCRFLYES